MMELKEIIKAFCTRLDLPFEANAEGVFAFEVDAFEFAIHDLSEEGHVALMGDLGLVPSGKGEGLFRLMLEAQHCFRETEGATFSIDAERDCLVLCRMLSCVALDEDSFFNEVERFVNLLEAWTRIVRDYNGQAEEHVEAPFDLHRIMV